MKAFLLLVVVLAVFANRVNAQDEVCNGCEVCAQMVEL